MSQDDKQKNKLVAQKEALGIYLDSLLGVSVFEENKSNAADIIDDFNKEQVKHTSDNTDTNQKALTDSNQSPSKKLDIEINQLGSNQDKEEISSKIVSQDEVLMHSEPSIDTGSLSVKYLNAVKNERSDHDGNASLKQTEEEPEKLDIINNEAIKKDNLEQSQTEIKEALSSSNKQAELQQSDNGDSGLDQLEATVDVADSHDIYRQKLLDRQKQLAQRKEQRQEQRQIQKQQQASKISLSGTDPEGNENEQVLIPRSQFLKNRQHRGKDRVKLGNSSGVISLEEKKIARKHIEQENTTEHLKRYQNDKELSKTEQSFEYARAANAKLVSDTAHSERFSESELLNGAPLEKQLQSPEYEENISLRDPEKNSDAIVGKAKIENPSISAFSRFAEQSQHSEDLKIADNDINFEKSEKQSGQQPISEESGTLEPQTKKEEKNRDSQQITDAPELELSLFLPKVPSLAEIEAIEQKEKMLKAQYIGPDISKEITADVSEQTIIHSGISISTELVSPHLKKQKSLVPNWAEPSFQAMFFDVAGLKLAIPLLELFGIVEWGKDFITPMPGHEKWYLGLLQYRGKSVPIIDTLQQVFPPNQAKRLLKERSKFKNIIMIDDGNWGLACEQIIGIRTIAADAVKWRTDQTKRRWLLGTVKEQMCALLDSKQFASMLKTGEDSLIPIKDKNISE